MAKKQSYEDVIKQMEEVVEQLESGDLTLDESIKLFERGVTLSEKAQKMLSEAEGKVEILVERLDGSQAVEEFEAEDEDEE